MDIDGNNFHVVSDEDIEFAIAAVKHGFDPQAAKNLIHLFHHAHKNGWLFQRVQNPKERLFLEYVFHAFSRIAEGKKSAEVAFGLKLGRGEYEREDTFERDIASVAHMILRTREGLTWLEAKGDAANVFFADGKGEKAIEAAYSQYSETLSLFPNDYLTQLITASK